LPTLVVENTQDALSKIATWHLHNIKPKVIAITGSNGKTTLKNMLKNILQLKALSGIGTNIPKGDIVYVNCINAQYLSDGVCVR
jgi:UDP-N-acetylmuramoylalanine-D-glutamate ligase